MKRILFAIFALFATSSLMAQHEIFNGPAISVDKDVHDYGTMKKNANGECTFTVTNVGTEPLILSKCEGSCGCTVPVCEKAPIMPGKSTTIKVTYDTKRIGPFSKNVTVASNAVNESTKMLTIRGSVEDDGTGGEGIQIMPMNQKK